MIKKLKMSVFLLLLVTGLSFAEDVVIHAGVGAHSTIYTDEVLIPSTNLADYPMGVGGFLGLGYSFGEKDMVSLGVEFAPSWDFSIGSTVDFSNFAYQARAFFKLKPDDLLSIIVFGGYAGNSMPDDIDINSSNLAVGGRLVLLFFYAEYSVVMVDGFSGKIGSNEISLGYTVLK